MPRGDKSKYTEKQNRQAAHKTIFHKEVRVGAKGRAGAAAAKKSVTADARFCNNRDVLQESGGLPIDHGF